MEFSEVSLAARVCSDEPGLAYSRQAALFQAIDRYEQDSIGILLLILCLFIWINSVITDASGALRMIAAVRTHMHVYLEDVCTVVHAQAMQLRGERTEICTLGGGKRHVSMLSNERVLWFVGVQLARLVIACLLGYGALCRRAHTPAACMRMRIGGARFLVRTIDLETILLNTVQLEVAHCPCLLVIVLALPTCSSF